MTRFAVVAVCSDDEFRWKDRVSALQKSADMYGVNLKVFYTGEPHKGNVHLKVRFFLESLKKVQDEYDVVAYLDAFDTFVYEGPAQILNKFLDMDASVVLSPSAYTYPEYIDRFPEYSENPYRFFNPGAYIGYTESLIEMLEEIDDGSFHRFDSHLWFEHYVNNPSRYKIDHEGKIFLTSNGERPGHISIYDRVENLFTGNVPSMIHLPATNSETLLYNRIKDHVLDDSYSFNVGTEDAPLVTAQPGTALMQVDKDSFVDFDMLQPVEFFIIPEVAERLAENDNFFVKVRDFQHREALGLRFFKAHYKIYVSCCVFGEYLTLECPPEEILVKYTPQTVANRIKSICLEFPNGKIENDFFYR